MENANLKDNINHPDHYTQGDIECIDAIKAATVDKKGIEAVYVSQVIKYVWRYTQKGGSESLRKASWYLNRLIKEVSDKECDNKYDNIYVEDDKKAN